MKKDPDNKEGGYIVIDKTIDGDTNGDSSSVFACLRTEDVL